MTKTCWYSNKCKLEKKNCTENCLRFQNMTLLIESSSLPACLQYPKSLYPEDIDIIAFNQLQAVKENILDFVDKGKNLYIWSTNTGNGKTTWASKLLLAYFNEIWAFSQLKVRGVYLYIPTLLNALKSQFISGNALNEYLDIVKNTNLVIFDDLGCGKMSDYDINNLLDIIDYRMNNGKSCIFTSNINKENLETTFGSRLTSRIFNSSLVVELKGKDRREV